MSDSSGSEIECNACGFEASYVPEGMLKCERCEKAHYCSLECLQWDWKSGGHADICVDTRPSPEVNEVTDDEVDNVTLASMDPTHIFDYSESANRSDRSTASSSEKKSLSNFLQEPSQETEEASAQEGSLADETLDMIQEVTESNDEPELAGSWRSRDGNLSGPTRPPAKTSSATTNTTDSSASSDPSSGPQGTRRGSLKAFRAIVEEGTDDNSQARRASLVGFRESYDQRTEKTHEPLKEDRPEKMPRRGSLEHQLSKVASAEQEEFEGLSESAALKVSINKALRDYESIYGKDAAASAVAQLTQGMENPETTPEHPGQGSTQKNQSYSSWALTGSSNHESSSVTAAPRSPTTPRYQAYRNSLNQSAEKKPWKGDNNKKGNFVAGTLGTAAVAGAATTAVYTMNNEETPNPPPEMAPKYLSYRTSLAKSVDKDNNLTTVPSELSTEAVVNGNDDAAIVSSSSSSDEEQQVPLSPPTRNQGYSSYRSSLAKKVENKDVKNEDEKKNKNGTIAAAAVGAAAVGGLAAAAAIPNSPPDDVSEGSFYSKYRKSLAQRVASSSGNGGSLRQMALEDALEAESSSSEDEDNDKLLEDRLNSYFDKGTKGAAAGAAVGTAAAVSVAASSQQRNPADIESVRAEQAYKINQAIGLGKEPQIAPVDYSVDSSLNDDSVQKPENENINPNSYRSANSFYGDGAVEAPGAVCLKPRQRENRFRNQWILVAICLFLVVLPLAIGLGVGLSRKDDNDRGIVPPPESMSPTSAPSLRGPTMAPTTGAPVTPLPTTTTAIPTSSPTLGPSGQPTTENPTNFPSLAPTTSAPSTAVPSTGPTTATPSSTPSLAPSTLVPTLAPTLVDQELFDLLLTVSPDGGEAMRTPGTPQNQAYLWLATEPQGRVDAGRIRKRHLQGMSDARKIQRFIMATFFYSTQGGLWRVNTDWLSARNECDWFTKSTIDVCNENGELTILALDLNNVAGELPREIGALTALTRLDLTGGGLGSGRVEGSLPSEIDELVNLEFLSLQNNDMSGSLQDSFDSMVKLNYLDLSSNRFSGSLPTTMGSLASLTDMNLSQNTFTGNFPFTFGLLRNVERMDLSNNTLDGPIPSAIGQATNLRSLKMQHNKFTSIPILIGALLRLQNLEIYNNELSGRLTNQIGLLRSLRLLDLHGNKLSGELPPEIGQLRVSLRELDLSDNSFSGEIPDAIGELAGLFQLQLQSNKFKGELPASLANMSLLNLVRVDDNDLTGVVPDSVCDAFADQLPKFYLDCEGNPPEVTCPPGTCCTYCCQDGVGCECVYMGTGFEFLC